MAIFLKSIWKKLSGYMGNNLTMSPSDIIMEAILQFNFNSIVYISIVDREAIVALMHARRSARTALMTDHLVQIIVDPIESSASRPCSDRSFFTCISI